MKKTLDGEHGVVCRLPGERFGYFGWPTVARLEDGQRVSLSRDDGKTWEHDFIIRDDGPHFDLGYPSTVELPGGELFTVYYQKTAADEKCSLLWSRWSLPTNERKG